LYGKFDLLADLDNLYHYFYGKDKIPAKLEPGNASYELAYSTTGIVDYLAELGGSTDKASPRGGIVRAFERITRHENALAERLLSYLRGRNDCRIIGHVRGDDARRVPTISFVIADRNAGDISRKMDAYKVALRFGDFHARRLLEYLGLTENGGVVRVSMTHYNTLDEVDTLIAALDKVLGDGS
jgi:selenocysteine lyase/cysteine desulfurase